jgi:hypothetical protein
MRIELAVQVVCTSVIRAAMMAISEARSVPKRATGRESQHLQLEVNPK